MVSKRPIVPVRIRRQNIRTNPNNGRTLDRLTYRMTHTTAPARSQFLKSCGSRDMLDPGYRNLTRSKATFFHSDKIFDFLNFQVSSQNLIPILKKSFTDKLLLEKIFHHVLLFTTQISSPTTCIRLNEMVGSCLLARTRCGMYRGCSFSTITVSCLTTKNNNSHSLSFIRIFK